MLAQEIGELGVDLETVVDRIVNACVEAGIAGVEIGGSAVGQPQKPSPADVTRLTGITPEMMAGKTIDFMAAAQFAGDSLIVAHNAGFDRRFVERFFPQLANNRWACSCVA